MTHEELLAGVVREWAEREWPGESAAAQAAAAVALRCYAGGASVSEACQQARCFAESWARHPSHWPVPRDQHMLVAS